jgi:hypothetical protein
MYRFEVEKLADRNNIVLAICSGPIGGALPVNG